MKEKVNIENKITKKGDFKIEVEIAEIVRIRPRDFEKFWKEFEEWVSLWDD